MVYKRVKGWTSGRSFPRHSLPNGVPCGLFTVPYFPVRSSRLSAMRYELPSWMSIKSTLRVEGAGGEGGLGGSEKNNFLVPLPLELHVWSRPPTPATSVHLKIKMAAIDAGNTRYVTTISRKNRGLNSLRSVWCRMFGQLFNQKQSELDKQTSQWCHLIFLQVT